MPDYFRDDPRSHRERMLAGDLYIADDPDNAALAQRAVQLADAYHQAFVADPEAARGLLTELLGHLGEGAVVKPPLFVDYGENIHIGARTFINYQLNRAHSLGLADADDLRRGAARVSRPGNVPAVFKEIAQEAKAAGLAGRYHVYAALAPYTGNDIEFYQIPDKVLEHIGFNARADAFNNDGGTDED